MWMGRGRAERYSIVSGRQGPELLEGLVEATSDPGMGFDGSRQDPALAVLGTRGW